MWWPRSGLSGAQPGLHKARNRPPGGRFRETSMWQMLTPRKYLADGEVSGLVHAFDGAGEVGRTVGPAGCRAAPAGLPASPLDRAGRGANIAKPRAGPGPWLYKRLSGAYVRWPGGIGQLWRVLHRRGRLGPPASAARGRLGTPRVRRPGTAWNPRRPPVGGGLNPPRPRLAEGLEPPASAGRGHPGPSCPPVGDGLGPPASAARGRLESPGVRRPGTADPRRPRSGTSRTLRVRRSRTARTPTRPPVGDGSDPPRRRPALPTRPGPVNPA